jgi:hypothetical protein
MLKFLGTGKMGASAAADTGLSVSLRSIFSKAARLAGGSAAMRLMISSLFCTAEFQLVFSSIFGGLGSKAARLTACFQHVKRVWNPLGGQLAAHPIFIVILNEVKHHVSLLCPEYVLK